MLPRGRAAGHVPKSPVLPGCQDAVNDAGWGKGRSGSSLGTPGTKRPEQGVQKDLSNCGRAARVVRRVKSTFERDGFI